MQRKPSKVELVEFVRRIMAFDGDEDEIDQMRALLEANVPHPYVGDLMFWPKGPEPTPEEVVEQALAYQPIITPPPSK